MSNLQPPASADGPSSFRLPAHQQDKSDATGSDGGAPRSGAMFVENVRRKVAPRRGAMCPRDPEVSTGT